MYSNTVRKNGWAYLSVSSSGDASVSNDMKMYAAGFLEGFTSAQQIRDFQHNAGVLLAEEENKHHALANIKSVFDKGLRTIREKSNMNSGASLVEDTAPADPWWRQARWALLQAWGTLDAYNRQAEGVKGKPMSMVDFIVLNSDGETPELELAYDMEESLLRQSQNDPSNSNDGKLNSSETDVFLQRQSRHERRRTPINTELHAEESRAEQRDQELRQPDDRKWRSIRDTSGRCSALVRLTSDSRDLMVGHTTFSDYSEMTRIFKYYDFPLGDGVVRKMGFSSYPGVAGSTDDYYLLDSGLVVTETTISMLTDEPYDKLDDNVTGVPDFMRIMLSNRLARNPTHWAQLMTSSATGTYSTQWIVVDYNQFKPGQPLRNGTLVVLEQVPGMSHTD